MNKTNQLNPTKTYKLDNLLLKYKKGNLNGKSPVTFNLVDKSGNNIPHDETTNGYGWNFDQICVIGHRLGELV